MRAAAAAAPPLLKTSDGSLSILSLVREQLCPILLSFVLGRGKWAHGCSPFMYYYMIA